MPADGAPDTELSAGAVQILRARAKALAQSPDAAATGALVELIEFRLAQERYAVETRYVSEVCPLKDLTLLPCTPPFVAGIVNVRGHILPVVDLRRMFELPEQGLADLHCIVRVRNLDIELGLLADVIVGVRSVAADSIQPAPATFSGIRGDYLKGLTAERLIVLDLARILADPRILVDEQVEN